VITASSEPNSQFMRT